MPGRGQPALLEREAELAALEAALNDARRGAGRLVVIEGSAGIGKTRLLEEARDDAADSGMRVLAARGTELERDFPFALVRQAFEPALVALEPGERERLLAGAARPAGPVVGLESPPDPGSPADPSFATLNALYWLTSNLAEAQPTLLALDDAHWSDSPSLRFFRFLIPRLEDLPVVLALAVRPAEGDAELLPELVADPAGSMIRPHELSRDAVAQLVREGLSADADERVLLGLPRDQRRQPVHAPRAAGRARRRRQRRDRRRGGTRARGRARDDPACGAGAACAAFPIRPPSWRARSRSWATMSRSPTPPSSRNWIPTAAAEAADALAAAGVIAPGRPLRFVHPLVRGAVYAELPGAAKTSAHRRAAELLEGRGAEPERIAVHLLATDPAEDPTVVEALSAAARRALDRRGAGDRDRLPAPRACRATGGRRAPRSAAAARAGVLSRRGPRGVRGAARGRGVRGADRRPTEAARVRGRVRAPAP